MKTSNKKSTLVCFDHVNKNSAAETVGEKQSHRANLAKDSKMIKILSLLT